LNWYLDKVSHVKLGFHNHYTYFVWKTTDPFHPFHMELLP
jgi:hypothetical protein